MTDNKIIKADISDSLDDIKRLYVGIELNIKCECGNIIKYDNSQYISYLRKGETITLCAYCEECDDYAEQKVKHVKSVIEFELID